MCMHVCYVGKYVRVCVYTLSHTIHSLTLYTLSHTWYLCVYIHTLTHMVVVCVYTLSHTHGSWDLAVQTCMPPAHRETQTHAHTHDAHTDRLTLFMRNFAVTPRAHLYTNVRTHCAVPAARARGALLQHTTQTWVCARAPAHSLSPQ